MIENLKADRNSGCFNTEGTHPANSRQIKQDYVMIGVNSMFDPDSSKHQVRFLTVLAILVLTPL